MITSNPNGVLAQNWSSDASVCSWIGVSCDVKYQRVTALNISGFNLGGTLAPHLGNLTFLRWLDISSNNFTGNIPSELFKLRRLEAINVGFNEFTGEIPSWFGILSELQVMHLNSNSFSGKIPPKLQILDMQNNFLDGDIPMEIGNLSSLETLNLAGNELTGAIPSRIFTNISSLMKIDLRYNMLSGYLPKDICSNSPDLKELYLSMNELEGEIPTNIYKCRMLEDIRLPINHLVQTQTIATIGYAAPEYASEGKVSTKGDVYSYGILLLEMFTGKKPTDDMFNEEMSLKEWVSEALQENAVSEIVASGLVSRDDQDVSDKEICVSSIFELAMKCLAFEPKERTSIAQVVAFLHKIKAKFTT